MLIVDAPARTARPTSSALAEQDIVAGVMGNERTRMPGHTPGHGPTAAATAAVAVPCTSTGSTGKAEVIQGPPSAGWVRSTGVSTKASQGEPGATGGGVRRSTPRRPRHRAGTMVARATGRARTCRSGSAQRRRPRRASAAASPAARRRATRKTPGAISRALRRRASASARGPSRAATIHVEPTDAPCGSTSGARWNACAGAAPAREASAASATAISRLPRSTRPLRSRRCHLWPGRPR
jgi:hypothetical protein